MKTLTLLLSLFFLSPAVFGQEVVEPVRVSVLPATRDQIDLQMVETLRSGLQGLRYVIAAEKKPDYSILVATTPITGHDFCGGYATAALVVNESNRRTALLIYTSDDLKSLARELAAKLEKEFFRPPPADASVGVAPKN